MGYKFEKLEVWQLALDYLNQVYALSELLPRSEDYNLKAQMIRSATSIALNVAEGSTSQSDAEQARFLGMAVRSLMETVACQHIISLRKYLSDPTPLREAYRSGERLFMKLEAFRHALTSEQERHRTRVLREASATYETDSGIPVQSATRVATRPQTRDRQLQTATVCRR